MNAAAQLSPIEKAWVIQAAENGDEMIREEEDINNCMLYRAVTPKYKLFWALKEEAFTALWDQAKAVYSEVTGVSAKDMAIKMYAVMRRDKGYGSKRIARLAKLEYGDGVVIKTILRRLRDAQKIRFADGRWFKI